LPLPVIVVEGNNGAEVWERSIVECYKRGVTVKTEYDQLSKDCTMLMVINDPLSEPRIHLSGLTIGRLEDLEMYVKEVVEGIHDDYVKEGKWSYSYHDRLCAYPTPSNKVINQIELIIKKLSATPYTRRAQAITWEPWRDPFIEDPPCLQRIICRIYDGELIMETSWRSRDAYKAAYMNIYAMTEMQRFIAERISEISGMEIKVGKYVDFSNFYHIYEKDWNDVENRFLKIIEKRAFETVVDESGRITVRGRAISTDHYRRLIHKAASL